MRKFYSILIIVWVSYLFGSWDDEDYWKDVIVGEFLIGYNETINVHKASIKELRLEDKNVILIEKLIPPLNIIKVKIPGGIEDMKKFMKLMKKEPGVKYVEPNRWLQLLFDPNDSLYHHQWDKRNMNCPKAWDITLGDTTISIAIIDMGVQYDHPDLVARFGDDKGYDFLDNDSDPRPVTLQERHGTHCAGVAASTINNGIGTAGVSNARLYAYRAGNERGMVLSECVFSIQEAANKKIKIISMSWITDRNLAPLYEAIKNAWDEGCLMFAGSGNTGGYFLFYPAAYKEVIAVGSIGPNDIRSSFSTYGPHLELVAPGENIIAPVPVNQYMWKSGTSMSTPNAAGAAALVWAVNPSLTNAEIREILCETAVDLGHPGRDQYYGYGKVDVYAAILAANQTTPFIKINATQINEPNDGIWDPGETITIIITLKNIGIEATNVKGVISTNDASVYIIDSISNYGTITQGGIANNFSDPYKVTATPSATDHDVNFNLHITADNGYSKNLDFKVSIGVKAGTIKSQFTAPGDGFVYGLAFDGTYLWASMAKESKIYKLNPLTGAVVGFINIPTQQDGWVDIDYDWVNSCLWLQNKKTRRIYKINPTTGAVEGSFTSPATQYPTGLTFDGSTLWVVDRDAYKIYNIRTDGTVIGNFSIPIYPRPVGGPRGLTFEPRGPSGGTLLLVMTHFRPDHTLDSSCVHEIKKDGQLVPNHRFKIAPPPTYVANARAIEFDHTTGDYWISDIENRKIYKVAGFYRQGIEEKEKEIFRGEFTVMPNPSFNNVIIRLTTPTDATIRIYDITGRLVYSIMNLKGNNTIIWNGVDNYGNKLPSGIYYCKLQIENYTKTRKVLLIR